MGRLATRFGGQLQSVSVEPEGGVRDLATIATENAIEGCVRETYGVLVAMWQARTAQDSQVRKAMRTIVRDEARHAGIAADVAKWIERRLSPEACRQVGRARREALDQLRATMTRDPAPALVDYLGMPCARDARRLFDAAVRAKVFPALAAAA
jgi:hypothetical protein